MRRFVPLVPLLAVLMLSACASERAASPASPSPSSSTGASGTTAPLIPTPEGPEADTDGATLDDLTAPVDPQEQALEDSWQLPGPSGTVPQIALRFIQALQRGDDLAADRELTSFNRLSLSFKGMWQLHVVMSDVRRHAGLAAAGRCTRARQIAHEAAVVECGHRRVVLKVVANRLSRGVSLSDWTAHYDVYRGSHTHAYTTIAF